MFGAIRPNNHPQEPHFQIPAECVALSVCYPPVTTLQKCRSFNFSGVAPDRCWCKGKARPSSLSSFITFTYVLQLTDVMSDTSWNQNKQHTEGNAYSRFPCTEGLKRLTSKQLPQWGRTGEGCNQQWHSGLAPSSSVTSLRVLKPQPHTYRKGRGTAPAHRAPTTAEWHEACSYQRHPSSDFR